MIKSAHKIDCSVLVFIVLLSLVFPFNTLSNTASSISNVAIADNYVIQADDIPSSSKPTFVNIQVDLEKEGDQTNVYNLVGWTTLVQSNATTAFIEPSNGTITSVFMFNVTTQRYVSYDKSLVEFGIPQNDFEVLPGLGYFVFATGEKELILE